MEQSCLASRAEISVSLPVVKGLSPPQILKHQIFSVLEFQTKIFFENIAVAMKYLHRFLIRYTYTVIYFHFTILIGKYVFQK